MTAITIVALQDPIAIVHIPVTSSSDHSTRLYWTLEHASEGSSEFFNITSNCIEVAIFASVDLVNSQWIGPSLDPSIKISQSSWRVFEISSGDQGETGNYDSPHLRHVSAPLAKAGITILYQSSYFTDFLLVKEVDFDKAAAIFADQGWNVDRSSDSSPSRRRSQLLSPMSPEPTPEPYSTSPTRSASDHPPPPEITVLSSPLGLVMDDACVPTPHMSPHRSPLPSSSRTRPLSLPITPRDSPTVGITGHEIPIQWSITVPTEESSTVPMTRVKGGRVSWIEPARENDSDTEDGICHQGLRGVARKRKSGKGRQRCLQLDLRGVAEDQAEEGKEVYHMDKSGLVTLFSNLLNSANIRMLYSSTFHTANILVDAGDVRRAKKLLGGR